MDNGVLQYQLRKNMNCDQKYSFGGMRAVYINLMHETEEYKHLPLIKERTLIDHLNSWAHSPDGWIVKEGVGKKAKFSKRSDYIWRCKSSRKTLIAKVANRIRSMKWKL